MIDDVGRRNVEGPGRVDRVDILEAICLIVVANIMIGCIYCIRYWNIKQDGFNILG